MLEIKQITFGFSPIKLIIKDLSLSLEEKKIYALMGSNGAGKTTMFNLISGFIKPQSGDIFFEHNRITHQQPYKINRQGIGRTFQDMRLIAKLSVKENIILAMKQNPTDSWSRALLPEKFFRCTNTALEKKADIIVERFFLQDVVNSFASEISYGQQKLLSLACCVSNDAKLLLIDEAVAGIQPEYRNKIAILIKQLKEEGKTILLIEHNTDFIAGVADQIYFLNNGLIFTFENIERLRNDKQIMEAYI